MIFDFQPENEAANLTDKSDVFSPVRLKFEHHLFFVFESVKHRNYYLGAKGNGQSKLVNTHSEAYRDSETLFKLIDPGRSQTFLSRWLQKFGVTFNYFHFII